MTFGVQLRKHRGKKRLSQQEVAEQIGVSQSTYHNWETDLSSFRVEFLSKLAALFDVEPLELIPYEGNKHQKKDDKPIVDVDISRTESHHLYADLLKSKDEII